MVSSSQAQSGEYIISGQSPGAFAKIQGGAVVCIWNSVNGTNESAVAVAADVRSVGFTTGQEGGGYDFCDGDNGGRFTQNEGSIFDATSDGTHIFAQVFGGPVIQYDMDWTNPQTLFTPSGGTMLSIAFDSSDNTLWTGGWGVDVIKHWAMDGTDLGGFTPQTTLNTALAVDPDGTIWESDRNVTGQFFQYDKSGTLLQTLNLGGDLPGFNILGGDMAQGPPPTGACCFADGSCQDGVTNQECRDAGGIAFNRDQACGDVNCNGACCLRDGSCVDDVTNDDCDSQNGTFNIGVACGDVDCPQPGACCLPGGACEDGLFEDECRAKGGVNFNVGQACADVDCPNVSIMTFESLECQGAGIQDDGIEIREAGLVLTKGDGEPFNYSNFCTGEGRYPGSTALFNNTVDGRMILKSLDENTPFAILQIKAVSLNGPGAAPLSFVGTKSDGSTVNFSVTTDGRGPDGGLETFDFPGEFDDLTTVEWTQAAPFHQFDDVTVSFVPPGPKCLYTVTKAKRKSDACGTSCTDCPVDKGDTICTIDCADDSDCPAKIKGFFRCGSGGACKVKADLNGCGDCPQGSFRCR